MQWPIINGIYTDNEARYRTGYPVNMTPVPKQTGVSAGYLRPAEGLVQTATGVGADRGAINWRDECYRVSGNKLIKVGRTGAVTEIGVILGTGPVTMKYSFDRLAIAGGGYLYYYDGGSLTRVTDPDLGTVVDLEWIDGYFFTTDGEFLVVTELNDPTAVDPRKYGSSEVDPDPVLALQKVNNEIHALNRYTIEVFDNVGGTGFPFQRIEGAQVNKGVIGTHACCIYDDAVAFVGGSRREGISVWVALSGQTQKVSDSEVDQLLKELTEEEAEAIVLESRMDEGHSWLYLHTAKGTIVYDSAASAAMQRPVWHILSSAVFDGQRTDMLPGIYRGRFFVWCYGQWLCGDPTSSAIGTPSRSVAHHWGNTVTWEFGTNLIYNEGRGVMVHELELVALTGRVAPGAEPRISSEYSLDGQSWSMPRYKSVGTTGQRLKRLSWRRQGAMKQSRAQRFRGDSNALVSYSRLEARVEPLEN